MKQRIVALCCLALIWSAVTAADEPDKLNATKPLCAKFKNIDWNERREWVESVTPVQYWKEQATRGCIATVQGVPTMMVEDKPLPVLGSYVGYLYHNYGFKKAPDVNYHNAVTDAMTKGGADYQVLYLPLYVDKRVVDWSAAQASAKELIRRNPNVRFFLRIWFIVNREEFARQNPGHMTAFEDGTEAYWSTAGITRQRYSYASNVWERQASECLVKMVREIGKQPYGDRIFGIFVTFGVSGEGGWWSEFNWQKHGIDYSPAMQDYFREYIRGKYKDAAALQKAWNNPQIASFNDVAIPSMTERGFDEPTSCDESYYKIPGGFGHFRNPQVAGGQKVIDFQMAMCNVLQERLSYFCEVIKRASGGKLLAGGLHSPPFAATGFHWSGPGGFGAILKSPYIDFMGHPWPYENRGLGESLCFRGPVNSMLLRNKCFWVECDTRTSSVKNIERKYGAPLNVKEDVEVLRRDFARLVTNPSHGYWYEITFPWFTEQAQRDVLTEIGKLSNAAVKCDRRRNSEIAVIYDWNSIFYASEFVDFIALCRQMLQEYSYIGADFDMYTTDDIAFPEVISHKLFIFPNAFCLNNETRMKIDKYLKRDKKVLLWSYAPGLINPDSPQQLSVAHCSELTGMNIDCINKRMSPLMKVNSSDPMIKNCPPGFQFGAQPRPVSTGPGYAVPEKPYIPRPIEVFPQFYVDDNTASSLALFTSSQKTGWAVKRMPEWTSIFVGTYLVPSEVLRAAAREAGAHLYLQQDNVVYHNRSFLGIHVSQSGKKTISLPGKCDIYDIFEHKLIGNMIDQFDVDAEKGKTLLYFTGNSKQAKELFEENRKN